MGSYTHQSVEVYSLTHEHRVLCGSHTIYHFHRTQTHIQNSVFSIIVYRFFAGFVFSFYLKNDGKKSFQFLIVFQKRCCPSHLTFLMCCSLNNDNLKGNTLGKYKLIFFCCSFSLPDNFWTNMFYWISVSLQFLGMCQAFHSTVDIARLDITWPFPIDSKSNK